MGNRLEGKVAIVTGGGRGIGRAESLALAAEGARVVVNDFGGTAAGTGGERGPADEVVEEIKKLGSDAVANYDNVADFAAGDRMVQQAMDSFGRLDIVINNAGILRDKMIFNMSEEEWDIVLAVHLKGHFNLSRHAAVVFRQQRSGVFVNTASESGLGNRGQGNYAAAKEGIIGLTRTLARDMGGYGVRANAIRPRAGTRLVISDEMRAAAARGGAAGMGLQALENFAKLNPPEAVAPFVVWLCTDAAENVNGRDFLVSGTTIGLYSLPEVIAKVDNPSGELWTLDRLDQEIPEKVTKGLTNQWPRKEEKPATA
ncbi:MAG TPA: SDR family NAD(P)-dependent oxidoreductase [Dehalococcoidia bacterium]|nr:SDR family NAD(P)-dependent oxidoreductase [Dehalococcoidia bacterium]